ncbi:hypothetical protein GF336_03890 [Candidatus Woesearchaeota archaeon]|nr:hypothetical protein [Candidatus Woesearchaeota archaeon]
MTSLQKIINSYSSKIKQYRHIISLISINLTIVFCILLMIEYSGIFSVDEFISLNSFFYIVVLISAIAMLFAESPKAKDSVRFFLFFLLFLLALQSFGFLDEYLSYVFSLIMVSGILIIYYEVKGDACYKHKEKKEWNGKFTSINRDEGANKKRLLDTFLIIFLILLVLAMLGFKIELFAGFQRYGTVMGVLAMSLFFYNTKYKEKKRLADTNILSFIVILGFLLFSLYALEIPGAAPDTIKYIGRGFHYIAEKFGYPSIVEWYNNSTGLNAVGMTGTPGVTSAATSAISIIALNDWLDPVVSSRVGHIIINAIFLILFYLFIKRIWGNEIAFYSVLLLACNPYFIALSRIPNPDSILPFFVSCSLFSFYILFKKSNIWMIVLAVFISLSVLTKISAVVLFPVFLIWVSLLKIKKKRQNYFKNMLQEKKNYWILSSIILAVVICIFFWPELDGKNSIDSFKETFLKSAAPYMHHPKEANYEVMGESYDRWPIHYYLVLLFVRLPVITLMLLFAGILYMSKDKRFLKDKNLLITAFIGFSLFFLSLSTKKGDKYHLFLYPCLSVIMAYGLYYVRRHKNQIVFFLTVLLVVLPGAVFSPYFFESYNALTNFGKNIHEFHPAGWGDGHKEAADYIIQEYGDNETILLMGYSSDFRRYYPGKITWRTKANPDLGVFYMLHNSIHPGSNNMKYAIKNGHLEKEIIINNVRLAEIYNFNE